MGGLYCNLLRSEGYMLMAVVSFDRAWQNVLGEMELNVGFGDHTPFVFHNDSWSRKHCRHSKL